MRISFLQLTCNSFIFSDQETPPSMLRLQALSNKGHGWLLVLHSMVNVIPINEPLGPAVITLVLDDCALPAKVPQLFHSALFLLHFSCYNHSYLFQGFHHKSSKNVLAFSKD